MSNWLTLHPKFVAAAITAGVLFLLAHSGVDISPLWQSLGPLIASYLAPSTTGG